MYVQPEFALDGMAEVRRLISARSWAVVVADGESGLQATHLPCLLDPAQDRGGLTAHDGFAVLEQTVSHFEAAPARPWQLESSIDYARRIATGTVAFRLRATRFMAKAKLSQDKPPDVRSCVIAALEPGPYQALARADEMKRYSPFSSDQENRMRS